MFLVDCYCSAPSLTRLVGLSAEPMLQLLCTVLQAEMAVLTLADGNRLVLRKGAVEVCEPGEPAERAGVWAWAPLPVEHELVTVEDTRLDERCGIFPLGAPDFCLCFPAYLAAPAQRTLQPALGQLGPGRLVHLYVGAPGLGVRGGPVQGSLP